MTAPAKKDASISVTHSISTGQTLQQNVEGHAARTDSPTFIEARTTLHKVLPRLFGGINPWETDARSVTVGVQAHHGGSILVYTKATDVWRVVLNMFGVEWCEQFACDPKKLELARQNAEAIIAAFPDTEPELARIGLSAAHIALLHTPITDATGVGLYVDSWFNACVPIPQPEHTGTVSAATPKGAGVHNYPLPACNIPMFCQDDFTPFVTTGTGSAKATAVVVPVDVRGSGNGSVRVIQTDKNHPLHAQHVKADKKGAALVLGPDHPIAKKAFAKQA